jgi:hypothetical protein
VVFVENFLSLREISDFFGLLLPRLH